MDLTADATNAAGGLSRIQLSYLGCVYFAVKSQTVDVTLDFLQKHTSIEAYVDVRGVESTEDVVSILDAGARKVFVSSSQESSLSAYAERIVPVFSASGVGKYSNGVLLEVEDTKTAQPVLEQLSASKASPIYLSSLSNDFEALVPLAKQIGAVSIIPSTNLSIDGSSKQQVSVSELIAEVWTSDRADKLIPTVVTDERGIALGLVYSSQESLKESLKTGTGVYQSRKRGLWYKGATSGDTQELVRISLDCDQDCLKFVVRQKGRGKA